MRKLPLFLALALAVPSLALAAKPPAPGNSQGSQGKAPQVMYVLKGTLTAYTAAAGATTARCRCWSRAQTTTAPR